MEELIEKWDMYVVTDPTPPQTAKEDQSIIPLSGVKTIS